MDNVYVNFYQSILNWSEPDLAMHCAVTNGPFDCERANLPHETT